MGVGGGSDVPGVCGDAAGCELQDVELALGVSNKETAHALERAQKAGIEALFIDPADFEARLQAELEARGIRLVVLAGFLRILSPEFTARWPRRILNIHPSLIPSFCGLGYYGLTVHEAALARGVKLTGSPVHFVNEIPDARELTPPTALEVPPAPTP